MRSTDDRYRLAQTESSISESFWETARTYGVSDRIAVDEQVAIVRRLAAILKVRSGPLRRRDVLDAFEAIGLRAPTRGFATDLIARLERLDPGRVR